MKRILGGILALGVCLTPITVTLTAQPSWAQTQDVETQIQQLTQQAIQQSQQGKPLKSIETLQQILTIARQQRDKELEAFPLMGMGVNYYIIGQLQQALENYNQALVIFRELGDRAGVAATLHNIGLVYYDIGQPQQILSFYEQALPILQEVGDRAGVAATLNNIGEVYHNIGQPQKALEYFEQALPILQEVGDRAELAATLNNIGVVYRRSGQPQKALAFYEQALHISREVGDRAGEARTLNNIAVIYRRIGQPQKALSSYEQALPILQEVGDRAGVATTLNGLGAIYESIGQPQQTLLLLEQALHISREVGDREGVATTLNNIGAVYDNIGQPQQALSFLEQALPISREVGDHAGEAITLNNIGLAYHNIGQPQQALSFLEQALPLSRKVGDRESVADTLSNLSLVYQDKNQPSQAIAHLEDAVSIVLEMRRGLLRENRKQFLEAESGSAIALADLLIDQNQPQRAFEWVNRATTFDLADYTRLIDADDKVANSEARQAIREWNEKNQQLEFLRQQLQDEFSEEKARQMRELEAQVNQEAEDIANRFPEVAELFETQPTDITQLRNNIPQATLVIQPVLLTGAKNVSNTVAFFLLTQDTLKVIQSDINPDEFNQLLDQYITQLADYQNADVYLTSSKLYEILIRPLEAQIEANSPKHLAIISTGKLRYIPFETLYDQQTDQFLLQKYPIHYLTRISSRSLTPSLVSTSSLKALSLANPQPTQQELKGTEAEAKYLQDNFPGSETYIGTGATLDTFKTQAPRFSILHLGTHGCFNLNGCPKLGMEANTILFANNEQYDIANAALLGLKNTELITLSACQTAKEANADGKEISGLAYVLERAGAKAVIASLWNAEDKTSSAIMTQFYNNIKEGMSKSEAMRQAKLSQINLHPWFWSPFILIGDGGK